jgi:hypothetical protein
VTAISGVRPAQGSTPPPLPVISQSAVTFHDAMRKLWEDQAVKVGDAAAYQDANARWYANAHDIAVFLSETLDPPLGSLAEMDEMMKDHLDRTTEEVVARLHSDWTGDVTAYDKVHNQALQMADMLSNSIIANFPAKFRP